MKNAHSRSWSKAEKWAVGLTTVPILFASACCARLHWFSELPVPAPQLPQSPGNNAYDMYLSAVGEYHAPATPFIKKAPEGTAHNEKLLKPPEFAVDMCYQYGFQNWHFGVQPRFMSPTYSRWYPPARKVQFLTENAACLTTLRAGPAYPYQPPPLPIKDHEPHQSPISQGERSNLFRTQARYYAQLGQWDKGSDCLLDLDKIGLNICSGGIRDDWWDGPTLRVSALEGLCAFTENMSLKQCRKLLGIFQLPRPVSATPASAFKRDELWRLDQLYRAMSEHHVSELLSSLYYTPDSLLGANLDAAQDRVLYAQAKRVLDWRIQKVKGPVGTWTTNWPFEKELRHSPLRQMLQNDLQDTQLFEGEVENYQAMLVAMLALRLYRLDNGHYPASLQSMVPKYLNSVPLDPYDHNLPLKYSSRPNRYSWKNPGPRDKRERFEFPKRTGPSEWDDVAVPYTLYSLGQDRTDEGGNSKSDLVATPYGLAPGEQMGGQ